MRYARTLWELMERRVDATPDALLAVDEDMRTLTFAELWSEAERAAAGLAAQGVTEGDVVSWQLPTWIESLVLTTALSRLGVVQNPLLPSSGVQQLQQSTAASGASLLVTPSQWQGVDHESIATEVARERGDLRVLIADRALPQGDPAILTPLPSASMVDEPPVRWLFPTSVGRSRTELVRHSDASLLAAARSMSQRLGLIPHDRYALVVPVAQVSGILWLLAALDSGCSNILCETFDPERTVEVLGREGVTLAGAGTAQHRGYLAEQRRRLEPIFPDVRGFTGDGSPKSPGLVDEVRAAFDVPVLSSYGCTEVPIVSVSAPTDSDDELAHSEGKPVPGVEVRIVGADGRIVDPGGDGEIRLRADQMMIGYLDRSLDDGAFDADGFFCTGDLGRFDDRGNLVVTGRREEALIGSADRPTSEEPSGERRPDGPGD